MLDCETSDVERECTEGVVPTEGAGRTSCCECLPEAREKALLGELLEVGVEVSLMLIL